MSFIDDKIADRLGGLDFGKSTEIYKFELIKRAKAEARIAHPELALIDVGVGEPDWAADASVVAELAAEAGKRGNRWYADNGLPEFQNAAAAWLEKTYGLTGISPAENIMHGIGSKPILALLPLCFINPGDVLLTTVPGYPVTATWTRYLGGSVHALPLLEANGFLPDLDSIPADVLKKAKLLYLNYPNNPTGAVATKAFFEKVVAFARANDILVIHDAAYGALTYGGCQPLSFLSIPGAMDVGVEIHSLSKAFNMTGWRMGFVCGNAKAVKAYATVKDNTDSGQFRAIQKAAVKALQNPGITAATIAKYSRRFDLLVEALRSVGFNAEKPHGSFYCYVRSPTGLSDGRVFKTAADFSEHLIREALISTVPWDEAGPYVRFSVTFEADGEAEERRIVSEMKKRLLGMGLRF